MASSLESARPGRAFFDVQNCNIRQAQSLGCPANPAFLKSRVAAFLPQQVFMPHDRAARACSSSGSPRSRLPARGRAAGWLVV